MSLPNTFKALVAYGRGKEPKLGQLPIPKPGKNQILAKVAFAPINPADIYTSHGLYPVPANPPHAVGLEGSGTVVAVGEDLKVSHQVGDRVHLLGVGSYGEYMLAEAHLCRKIKGDLSFEEAAPHYVNPFTAVCMGDIVRKNGHKAVINTAGSSAIGRMIIRYFNHKGIKTINIVRRDDYIDELKKDGASYVLNSKAPDFEQKLRELARKEEATVAFDAIGGELTTQVLKNQPDGSSCYIYGSLGGVKLSDLSVQQFIFQDKTLSGLWLNTYLKKAQKLGEAERILDEVYDLLPTVLSSNIQKVFKLGEIEEAFEYYKDNSSKGKILLQPN